MKNKTPDESILPPELDLNLPDAPDYISHPPNLTFEENIALCEKMLPYWNLEREKKAHVIIQMEPFVLD